MDPKTEKRLKNTIKKAHTYLLLTLAVLAGTAYYGYTQYLDFSAVQHASAQSERTLKELQDLASDLEVEYTLSQDEYFKQQDARIDEINAVFPPTETFHTLTRQLEDYFVKNNVGNQRMFLQSLTFGKPTVPNNADKIEADYMILPVTIGIESSRENFFKFLEYLENSGSFESKTRLMSLESISFSFPEEGEETQSKPEANTLRFNLQINAYFQKQV